MREDTMLDHSIYEYGILESDFNEYILRLPGYNSDYDAFGKFARGFIGPQSKEILKSRKKINDTKNPGREKARENFFNQLNDNY
jgi:hypothetical protein